MKMNLLQPRQNTGNNKNIWYWHIWNVFFMVQFLKRIAQRCSICATYLCYSKNYSGMCEIFCKFNGYFKEMPTCFWMFRLWNQTFISLGWRNCKMCLMSEELLLSLQSWYQQRKLFKNEGGRNITKGAVLTITVQKV